MRTLIVGLQSTSDEILEGGYTGRRLESLAGLPDGSLGERFALTNLLGPGEYPGAREARTQALVIAAYAAERVDRVLLLGNVVAAAFGVSCPILTWRYGVASIPHPSGRNRWWNVPENRYRAARFLRRTAETAS